MAPAPLLLSPNLDRHLPFFSPRPSPTLGSESTPFLFVPPSPALSQSSFRTPPPSPRLGSFIVNSIDTVVPPNLKRVRKSTSSLVLLALAVTALFALGSYAVRSEASVGVRLKEWHSSFATAEALPDTGEDTGAEDPVDLQADEDEFGPSTPNVTSSAPADVLPPSTTPTALPVQEEVRPPSLPTPSAALPTTGPIPVSALPRPRLPLGGSTEKFIGYLPHSGFHNQRIELQNALLLGKLMNRTVLIPPVWIGWPTPTQNYDQLQAAWTSMMLMNPSAFNVTPSPSSPLWLPGNYTSSAKLPGLAPNPALLAATAERAAQHLAIQKTKYSMWEIRPDGYPITNLTAKECKSYSVECRHTYKDTFLGWEFLVNFDGIARELGVVDRFDIREKAVEGLLGITPDEVFVMQDYQRYAYKFVDRVFPNSALVLPDLNPSTPWQHRVSIPTLTALPHRLILVGSLFGSGRVLPSVAQTIKMKALEDLIGRSMAFRNSYLMKPALAIQERMGGHGNYVGVHARIGDGKFLNGAKEGMETSWWKLVRKMKVKEGDARRMWELVGPAKDERLMKRGIEKGESAWAHLDEQDEEEGDSFLQEEPEEAKSSKYTKRAPLVLPSSSRHLKNLTCRSPLHTNPAFTQFNTPLYLATDSLSPLTSPHLASFFHAFPCTFILSDFSTSSNLNSGLIEESFGEMGRLINEMDGIGLGRLLVPFLEAMIAAKGILTVGTQGSTFSSFAQGHLHQAYMLDQVSSSSTSSSS